MQLTMYLTKFKLDSYPVYKNKSRQNPAYEVVLPTDVNLNQIKPLDLNKRFSIEERGACEPST